MTLMQLKYFCEICKWGSMSKAAEVLFVSQPAISSAIRKLEEEFATTLLIRQNDGWRLTNAGKTLLASAQTIMTEVDNLTAQMQREHDAAGNIKIGMPPIYANWVLAQLEHPLSEVRKRYPRLEVMLHENGYYKIEDAFKDEKLDFLFCTVLTDLPDYLTQLPLSKHRLCVCMSRRHPLAGRTEISLRDVANEPFVANYNMNSNHGKRIRQICDQAGVVLRYQYYFRQARTVKDLVGKGKALCFAYQEISDMADDEIVVIPVKEAEELYAQLAIVYDNRFEMRNEMLELINIFIEEHEKNNT